VRVLLIAAPLFISFSSFSSDVINDYGEYVLSGRLTDGDTHKPGANPGVISLGGGYPGLLLDTPLNVNPVFSGNLKNYRIPQNGYLNHIQLDLYNEENSKYYKVNYGKHVRIRCNIDFVGRYYTPVYCEPLKMNIL